MQWSTILRHTDVVDAGVTDIAARRRARFFYAVAFLVGAFLYFYGIASQ